jgi:nitroreductase
MDTENMLAIIRHRRSVRVYKSGKLTERQLATILEAARWAPSGANTQPWEFVVTRDRKKMKQVREIYSNEWRHCDDRRRSGRIDDCASSYGTRVWRRE